MVVGIPLMKGWGPKELLDSKVGIPANRLAEHLKEHGGSSMGLGLQESLERLQKTLDDYRFWGHVPDAGVPLTRDAAEQRAKWFLFTKYNNKRVRLGQSSKDYDYSANETLMKAADVLSYYLTPDGDKVVLRFTQGQEFEPQIRLEGYALQPMPGEVKCAVCALLGLVGATLQENGKSYVINAP